MFPSCRKVVLGGVIVCRIRGVRLSIEVGGRGRSVWGGWREGSGVVPIGPSTEDCDV